MLLIAAACTIAAAESIPLPHARAAVARPRPAPTAPAVTAASAAAATPAARAARALRSVPAAPAVPAVTATAATVTKPEDVVPEPSACRLRLTPELALAPSVPPLAGPSECGAA